MTCLRVSCFYSDHTALMVCVEMTVTFYQAFASQVSLDDYRVCLSGAQFQIFTRFQIFYVERPVQVALIIRYHIKQYGKMMKNIP